MSQPPPGDAGKAGGLGPHDPASSSQEPGAGRLFGVYRTVRELGRGGMGVVYLAERIDGHFEQRVAVKVLSGGARPELRERFARERQILADLEHPNIARLLAGGVGESGEPYLAMELVDGVPIDRYCHERRLSTRRRLRLLVSVCSAVQAAHRLLVVHRDIKPSNVLVESGGEVKLVDFGIATLLDGGAALTQTGGRMMTPQYASPEQFLGRPVGVATDVYQLGLLAYELLTGRRPYELETVAPAEAIRLVCHEEPPPPSSTVTRTRPLDTSEAAVAFAERHLDADLDPDLDAIVLKAMRKEPEQRYGSADLLRADFERYLDGLPISARAPTAGYRLRKFVGRHRAGVALTTTAVLLMVAMAFAFTRRLVDERDRTRAAAERATQAKLESEEVTGFLVGLFEVTDPDTHRGETVTARELLDRGAERMEGELGGQPRVKGRVLHTIANIYRRLGLFEDAERLFREALELRRRAGAELGDLATTRQGLALVLARLGRLEEAESLVRRALEEIEASAGPNDPDDDDPDDDDPDDDDPDDDDPVYAVALHQLAALRTSQGHLDEGETLLRRAVEILERAGDHPEELAQALSSLGSQLHDLGRFDAAERVLRRTVELRQSRSGPDALELVRPLNNLATLYASTGRLEQSLETFERAYRLQEKAFGEDHPGTLLIANNKAILYLELGRLDEAAETLDLTIAAFERTLGPLDLQLLQALNNRGNVALARRRFVAAESFYRRGLDIAREVLGPAPRRAAMSLSNLGEALVGQGRVGEAEDCFRRSIELLDAGDEGDPFLVSWPVLNLARLLEEKGELQEAGELYRRALEIRRRVFPPESEELREAADAWTAFSRRLEKDAPS